MVYASPETIESYIAQSRDSWNERERGFDSKRFNYLEAKLFLDQYADQPTDEVSNTFNNYHNNGKEGLKDMFIHTSALSAIGAGLAGVGYGIYQGVTSLIGLLL